MITLTLVPAYGRDYHSKAAALADYHQGKDFIVTTVGFPHTYINKQQIQEGGFDAKIRYAYQRKVVAVPR